ncbi:MAG: polysaccharide biosynthesis C-terminal domain-containing protein [Chloroflexi bacterium]|nr:polysaccharide biosynthesis C-terminal domain-containing protein [Chloroflexota bacterium]
MSQDVALQPVEEQARNDAGLRRQLLRGVSLTFGSSVLIQGLGVVSGIITARVLGLDGKGALAAIAAWPGLLTVLLSFAAASSVTYHVASFTGRERQIFAASFWTSLLLSLIALVPGWLLIGAALGHSGAAVVALGRLNLLGIPLGLVSGAGLSVIQGKEAFARFNGLRLLTPLLTVITVLGLLIFGKLAVATVVATNLGISGAILICTFVLLKREGWLGFRVDWKLAQSVAGYGLRAHLGGISSLINQRGDQLLMSIYLSVGPLGLYAAAVSLSSAVAMLGPVLYTVVLPVVAATGREQGLRLTAQTARLTVSLSGLLVIMLVPVMPIIVRFTFGPAFLPGVVLAQWLLVAAAILNVNHVLISGMQACGRALAASIAEGVAACVSLVSLVLLLPRFGPAGGVIASIAAYTVSCGVLLGIMHKKEGYAWWSFLFIRPREVRTLLSSLRMRMNTSRLKGYLGAFVRWLGH